MAEYEWMHLDASMTYEQKLEYIKEKKQSLQKQLTLIRSKPSNAENRAEEQKVLKEWIRIRDYKPPQSTESTETTDNAGSGGLHFDIIVWLSDEQEETVKISPDTTAGGVMKLMAEKVNDCRGYELFLTDVNNRIIKSFGFNEKFDRNANSNCKIKFMSKRAKINANNNIANKASPNVNNAPKASDIDDDIEALLATVEKIPVGPSQKPKKFSDPNPNLPPNLLVGDDVKRSASSGKPLPMGRGRGRQLPTPTTNKSNELSGQGSNFNITSAAIPPPISSGSGSSEINRANVGKVGNGKSTNDATVDYQAPSKPPPPRPTIEGSSSGTVNEKRTVDTVVAETPPPARRVPMPTGKPKSNVNHTSSLNNSPSVSAANSEVSPGKPMVKSTSSGSVPKARPERTFQDQSPEPSQNDIDISLQIDMIVEKTMRSLSLQSQEDGSNTPKNEDVNNTSNGNGPPNPLERTFSLPSCKDTMANNNNKVGGPNANNNSNASPAFTFAPVPKKKMQDKHMSIAVSTPSTSEGKWGKGVLPPEIAMALKQEAEQHKLQQKRATTVEVKKKKPENEEESSSNITNNNPDVPLVLVNMTAQTRVAVGDDGTKKKKLKTPKSPRDGLMESIEGEDKDKEEKKKKRKSMFASLSKKTGKHSISPSFHSTSTSSSANNSPASHQNNELSTPNSSSNIAATTPTAAPLASASATPPNKLPVSASMPAMPGDIKPKPSRPVPAPPPGISMASVHSHNSGAGGNRPGSPPLSPSSPPLSPTSPPLSPTNKPALPYKPKPNRGSNAPESTASTPPVPAKPVIPAKPGSTQVTSSSESPPTTPVVPAKPTIPVKPLDFSSGGSSNPSTPPLLPKGPKPKLPSKPPGMVSNAISIPSDPDSSKCNNNNNTNDDEKSSSNPGSPLSPRLVPVKKPLIPFGSKAAAPMELAARSNSGASPSINIPSSIAMDDSPYNNYEENNKSLSNSSLSNHSSNEDVSDFSEPAKPIKPAKPSFLDSPTNSPVISHVGGGTPPQKRKK